jgi:hypothetical protein
MMRDLVEQVAKAMWDHRVHRDMVEYPMFVTEAEPWEGAADHVKVSIRNEARAVVAYLRGQGALVEEAVEA